MSQFNDGNQELFVTLITANYDHLRRYIYTLLPHEEDTKDVLQEVCIAISQKFDQYDRTRPFLPWACRFAYLKVLKFLEQQRPRRMVRLPTARVVGSNSRGGGADPGRAAGRLAKMPWKAE